MLADFRAAPSPSLSRKCGRGIRRRLKSLERTLTVQTMLTRGMLRDRARGMRRQTSRAEEAVWSLLRGRRISGAKFRRQHPIPPYIADFACVEAKLIIEVDGRSHDEREQLAHDAVRTEALSKAGWRVLRVRDDEVFADAQSVAAKILEALAR
ncbi:MAG: endonuclease domain-containing protein [Hyphomonadaceae bacterium]